MWRENGNSCDKHFQNPGHKFNQYSKFVIAEKINIAFLPKHQRQSPLGHREDFWIL